MDYYEFEGNLRTYDDVLKIKENTKPGTELFLSSTISLVADVIIYCLNNDITISVSQDNMELYEFIGSFGIETKIRRKYVHT